MRRTLWLTAATVAVAFLLTAPQLRAVQLDEARIFIEFNATDQDVGIHVFLDGEQWKRMKIFDPNGRKIFDVSALSNLGSIGLTELFVEGEEPSLDELPLDEFFELFPEGVYLFLGQTVEGKKLHRRVRFSHDIPDAPSVIFPQEGDVVDPAHAVISWEPVTSPPGVEIAGYEVIVENEDLGVEFSVLLPATATSVTIPAELLAPDTEYDFEVLAIEESGNQTITESSFVTE